VAAKNMLVHLPSLVEGKDGFLSHSESYFTGVALDYPIDLKVAEPNAGWPFLSQLWPDDQESIQTLQEWFGYCLLPDTSQQKILFVLGAKRSGKGTIARVLTGLLDLKMSPAHIFQPNHEFRTFPASWQEPGHHRRCKTFSSS